MGKTADLTVVQKTIIDTLHKEGKTQTFITKEAVHRVLYPSMLTESWVEGKSVEEKDAQPTERTAALWGLSSKIDSRIWVNFTRNGLRLGSRHQEPFFFKWQIVLLDKTLIRCLVLFIGLWSYTETVMLTFNRLESIEANYMDIHPGMFSSKTFIYFRLKKEIHKHLGWHGGE